MKRLILIVVVSLLCLPHYIQAETKPEIEVFTGLDKPIVLAGRDQEVILKVGLRAKPFNGLCERLPLNVAIVLDKSGSMGSQNKMENAKQGVIEIIDRLNEDDVVSVIVYDSEPWVLIEAQHLSNKERIIQEVRSIYADGNTALYGGVELGAQQLREFASDHFLSKIILLSDGLANVGPSSTEDLAYLGSQLYEEGVNVTTVGVGLDYNEDLMTTLAQEGGGNSYFAQNSDELPDIFAEEVDEAMTVAAKNIKIGVYTSGGVEPIAVIGRKGRIRGSQMQTEISSLYAKNDKYALFQLEIPQLEAGKTIETIEVRVEYTDPFTGEVSKRKQNVAVSYHSNKKLVKAKMNKDIIKEFALTRTSEIKKEAVKLSDQGRHEEAANYLKNQGVVLEKVAQECDNDTEVLAEAGSVNDLASEVKSNRGFSRAKRKWTLTDSFGQMNQQYSPAVRK
jgi:Ca-activated chloride channel family protein